MARSIKGNSALARPYRDLVWLAYLTLPPDSGERRVLLAHRLAARALLRRPGDPEQARLDVLKRVLKRRPYPLIGFGRRLEVVPAVVRSDERAFTTALEELPPAARAAYALTRIEGLDAGEARRLLGAAGVAEPTIALALIDALDDEHGRLEDHRPAADPTLARIYGRGPSKVLITLAAAAGLLAVAGVPHLLGLHDVRAATSAPALPEVSRVSPGTWRTTTTLDLHTWEPRGDLTDDDGLVTRAVRAWQGEVTAQPVSGALPSPPVAPQLLYAGRLDGTTVVLLRDSGRVARYAETGRSRSLEVFPEPRLKADGSTPLKLSGGRYLVPPWVTEVSAATLSRLGAKWRPVALAGGVTGPVPQVTAGPCWRGPVLRLRAPGVAHGMAYTMLDLGRLALANVTHQAPPPAEINRMGPEEIDVSPGGFSAWAHLSCALPFPPVEAEAATAWEFWSGELPESARARWMCARFSNADGTSSVRAVLAVATPGRTVTIPTGSRAGTWDCSRLKRHVVAATWWQAPSGQWYYLVAGSRDVARITVTGPTVKDVLAGRGLIATLGPNGGTQPTGEVTVTAGTTTVLRETAPSLS
ncbi:hypothetical protein GT755_07835 [Herbidospora sp. NEAU-GS84]|uniref:DNA-directed RNA polymerase specialized sigma24 family protein n=1 Tax=Herbidospora solisilvae TaxID=2696284 RepID=A0A7C9N625_9ACTN|nr:hypothetical protein [Herbidospora solisilvae]NAS21593.1 hypothetical protein [Herbidospora solisilvae]